MNNYSNKIKHPYIFNPLHTINIKEDLYTHQINWKNYVNKIFSYVNNNNNNCHKSFIITPKYIGCPFEVYFNYYNQQIKVSLMGDGRYGKDISKQLTKNIFNKEIITVLLKATREAIIQYSDTHGGVKDIVFRGEILVNKIVFKDKYSDKFDNQRAFIAYILNTQYDKNDKKLLEQINDLVCIIDDIKYKAEINGKTTKYKEFDWAYIWSKLNDSYYQNKEEIYFQVRSLFHNLLDSLVRIESIYSLPINLENIYNIYKESINDSQFDLKGFVIKPTMKYRNNINNLRYKDCAIIKIMPIVKKTIIEKIE